MKRFRAKHHSHLPLYLAGVGLLEALALILRHGHP